MVDHNRIIGITLIFTSASVSARAAFASHKYWYCRAWDIDINIDIAAPDHDYIDKDIGDQWSVIMISIDIASPETSLIMISLMFYKNIADHDFNSYCHACRPAWSWFHW